MQNKESDDYIFNFWYQAAATELTMFFCHVDHADEEFGTSDVCI